MWVNRILPQLKEYSNQKPDYGDEIADFKQFATAQEAGC